MALSTNRFQFGDNWSRFIHVLTEERILAAESSLLSMLAPSSLLGKRFLDVGCGSGLFSLAARRLGADVCSFDFDALSVKCAEQLRSRYSVDGTRWTIQRGSVLDDQFMRSLGQFDIVYCWGVLHHTGALWTAMEKACAAVADGGCLWVAIYNDQGSQSAWWLRIKRTYNQLPGILRLGYLLLFGTLIEAGALAAALVTLDPGRVAKRWRHYQRVRGMSRWHDLVDWIGGFPFEVAKPERVFEFCRDRGFTLERLVTCGSRMGCNEFVFRRIARS